MVAAAGVAALASLDRFAGKLVQVIEAHRLDCVVTKAGFKAGENGRLGNVATDGHNQRWLERANRTSRLLLFPTWRLNHWYC